MKLIKYKLVGLTEERWQQVDDLAKRQSRYRSQVLREAIETYLDAHQTAQREEKESVCQ
jgi:metal-responsive CopG/Arc/MetJ family transcriptional regulator